MSGRRANVARDAEPRTPGPLATEARELVASARALLEELVDPLQHILRNAVDHAFETPPERREAGKAETGSLRVSLERRSDTVLVTVEDDGRGMDPERIRRKAMEGGFLDRDSSARSLRASLGGGGDERGMISHSST